MINYIKLISLWFLCMTNKWCYVVLDSIRTDGMTSVKINSMSFILWIQLLFVYSTDCNVVNCTWCYNNINKIICFARVCFLRGVTDTNQEAKRWIWCTVPLEWDARIMHIIENIYWNKYGNLRQDYHCRKYDICWCLMADPMYMYFLSIKQ